MFKYKKLYEITENQLKRKEQEIYDLKMENQKLRTEGIEAQRYMHAINDIANIVNKTALIDKADPFMK